MAGNALRKTTRRRRRRRRRRIRERVRDKKRIREKISKRETEGRDTRRRGEEEEDERRGDVDGQREQKRIIAARVPGDFHQEVGFVLLLLSVICLFFFLLILTLRILHFSFPYRFTLSCFGRYYVWWWGGFPADLLVYVWSFAFQFWLCFSHISFFYEAV